MLDKIQKKVDEIEKRRVFLEKHLEDFFGEFKNLYTFELFDEKKDVYGLRVNVVKIVTKTSSVKMFFEQKKPLFSKSFFDNFGEKVILKIF